MVGLPFPNFSDGAALTRRVRAVTPCHSTRRALILAAGAWTVMGWQGAAWAQSKQVPVLIGWLNTGSRETGARGLAAFKEGMAALGWKEGSQFVIEERWADGQVDRLPSLAMELAARKPATIVSGTGRATIAAAKAAPKTPIVHAVGLGPVDYGLAKSLARPGGMVTGITNLTTELTEKYLELLLAAAPKLKRVGFLSDSTAATTTLRIDAARRSVARFAVEASFAQAGSSEEIESAIARLAKEGAQGLIVMGGAFLSTEQRRVIKLALAHRWPVAASNPGFTEAGALLSYSADNLALYRRSAYYVDRILKGAKPGDLPIEQPTKFELVLNMKTAKALKLDISRELAVRADRVIE